MKIEISPSLPLFLISLAVSKDTSFVLIPASAAFIHECGHLLAAKLLHLRIKAMRLGIFGAAIEADMLHCSYGKEILLALCGPLANILTAFLVYAFAGIENSHLLLFFVSSLLFAALNLLPAGSFDGGRIFSSSLHCFLPPGAACRISEAVSFLVFFVLWTASVYFILRTGAYLSLFIFSWTLFTGLFLSNRQNSQT